VFARGVGVVKRPTVAKLTGVSCSENDIGLYMR